MSVRIEISNLSKCFKKDKKPFYPVKEVSISIEPGEFFGLVGHNGAGKTTLLKILATLIEPSEGEFQIAGHTHKERHQIRNHIGLLTANERSFYWRLTGRQNLDFFATLIGLHGAALKKRVQEVIDLMEISDFADQRFDQYSAGMKQQASIARLMLHKPKLLLLDEPTRSLDVEATQRTEKILTRLREEENITMLMVTHKAFLARQLCNRIGRMENGKLVEITEIRKSTSTGTKHRVLTSLLSLQEQGLLNYMAEISAIVPHDADNFAIIVNESSGALHAVLAKCIALGLPINSCEPLEGDLT